MRRYSPLRLAVEPRARLKMQAASPIRTVCRFVTIGAQIARAQEPDAGKSAIEFVDKSLRDGGENLLQIQTRGHLERDPLQHVAR